MTIFYKWRSKDSVEKLLLSMKTDLDYEYHKNNKICVKFSSSRDFNRYSFKGKFLMKDGFTELRGVFCINHMINYTIFIISTGCMISIMYKFPPTTLVNIICCLVYLLFLIVFNFIFYIITVSCHNWSLFFYEDREKFLKIVDKYMVRNR